ncbi:MAG: DoxX family protein [Actinomycetales bacterium]
MGILVWVMQVVLALAFLGAGFLKLTRPKQELRLRMAWVESFAPRTIHLIGAAEVLGAIGLVLPAATGIAPFLTPLAAACLALVMIGGIWVHATRRDPAVTILPAAVLLALLVLTIFGLFAVDRA